MDRLKERLDCMESVQEQMKKEVKTLSIQNAKKKSTQQKKLCRMFALSRPSLPTTENLNRRKSQQKKTQATCHHFKDRTSPFDDDGNEFENFPSLDK